MNGWQRLWILLGVLGGVPLVWLVWLNEDPTAASYTAFGWVIFGLIVYAAGLGVAWVVRGFRMPRSGRTAARISMPATFPATSDRAQRWVEKRHNCRATSVLGDLEWDAERDVQTRAEQLEGSGEPLPELGRHREDPVFYVKREGKGFVSFSLGCFPESGDMTVRVRPPDDGEHDGEMVEWCIQVRPGRNSPCVLVLETSGPFPRSGENPPEQVKALDAVLGEELEPWQVLYKVLDPILF